MIQFIKKALIEVVFTVLAAVGLALAVGFASGMLDLEIGNKGVFLFW